MAVGDGSVMMDWYSLNDSHSDEGDDMSKAVLKTCQCRLVICNTPQVGRQPQMSCEMM